MPKRGTKSSKRQHPIVRILEEYVPEPGPWRKPRGKPGIRVVSTTRRMPGEKKL